MRAYGLLAVVMVLGFSAVAHAEEADLAAAVPYHRGDAVATYLDLLYLKNRSMGSYHRAYTYDADAKKVVVTVLSNLSTSQLDLAKKAATDVDLKELVASVASGFGLKLDPSQFIVRVARADGKAIITRENGKFALAE